MRLAPYAVLRVPAVAAFAVCALLIALIVAPLAFAHGVPSFEQDWQWPAHRAQSWGYARQGLEPWNSNGIGVAQTYPAAWLPYLAGGVLCAIIGPQAAIVLFIALLLAIAALGIYLALTQFEASRGASLAAVAWYIANPVVLNEIHAGHLNFLVSYSFLALFCAGLAARGWRPNGLVLGAVMGATCAQQQFFFLAALLLVVYAVHRGPQWSLRVALPAFITAIAFTAPQWILALTTHDVAALNPFRPLAHWYASQSASFLEAMRLSGYIGGYDGALIRGSVRSALWLIPLLAVAAIALRRRNGMVIVWGVLALFGICIAAGTHGPLSVPLGWLILRAPFGGVFRELYNAQALTALAFALLCGVALTHRRDEAQLRLVRDALKIVVMIICAAFAYRASYGIPALALDASAQHAIRWIAQMPGDERYMALPAALPQRLHGAPVTGLSPFLLPIGSHPAALDALYEAPYSTFVARSSAHRSVNEVIATLGVGATLQTSGITVASNYEPQLQHLFPFAPARSASTWNAQRTPGSRVYLLRDSTGPAALSPFAGGAAIDLYAFGDDPNPKRSWARTVFWNNLPRWIYERRSGIFTLSSRRDLNLPRNTLMIAGDARGTLRAQSCRPLKKLDAHFVLFACVGATRLSGTPPLAVAKAAAGARVLTTPRAAGKSHISIVASSPWKLTVRGSITPGTALVLTERYSEGWRCKPCIAFHVEAAHYANAWVLTRPFRGTMELYYAPAQRYFIALAISMLIAVMALAYGGQQAFHR